MSPPFFFLAAFLAILTTAECFSTGFQPKTKHSLNRLTSLSSKHSKDKDYGCNEVKRSEFLSIFVSGTAFLATTKAAFAEDFKSYFSKTKGPSGKSALISFKYPKKWAFSESPRVFAKNEETKDNVYLEIFESPSSDFEEIAASAILDRIFDSRGWYSQFGKPDDYRAASSKLENIGGKSYRYIDVRFTALSPTQRTVERRGVVLATAVGSDIFLLFGSSTAIKWKTNGEQIKESVLSFRANEAVDSGKSIQQQKKFNNDLDKLEQIRAAKEFQF